MNNGYGTRLPRSYEMNRMSAGTRALVIFAHRRALQAERAGLEVGFSWNRGITIDQALRSVDDRLRTLNQRAAEFGINHLFDHPAGDLFDRLREHEFDNRYCGSC